LQGRCLNLRDQVNLFQNTVENDLPVMINSIELSEHLSNSIYVFIIGTNDYISNYLGTKTYQSISFAELLITTISDQVKVHYISSTINFTYTLMKGDLEIYI